MLLLQLVLAVWVLAIQALFVAAVTLVLLYLPLRLRLHACLLVSQLLLKRAVACRPTIRKARKLPQKLQNQLKGCGSDTPGKPPALTQLTAATVPPVPAWHATRRRGQQSVGLGGERAARQSAGCVGVSRTAARLTVTGSTTARK